MKIFRDLFGNEVRLTNERLEHIEARNEMKNQLVKIRETLSKPEKVLLSNHDEEVYLYYKNYPKTPVTNKFLSVIVNITSDDAFILTAFFTDKIKTGVQIWPK